MIQDDTRLIQRNVVKTGRKKAHALFKKTLLFLKKITTSLKSINFKPIAMHCIN